MKRLLSRRALLRGAGVTLALPLLEAMEPALALGGSAPAKPPCRMVFLYASTGMAMPCWTPKGEGRHFEWSPTLAPLKDFRNDLLVLSGLDHRREEKANNEHDEASSALLSTAPIGQRDRSSCGTAVSVDQLAAQRVGKQTRLPSLEIGCDADSGRIHVSNISWRGPAMPMGREVRPRQVFTRMFGDPRGDAFRRSILDYVLESAGQLRNDLGVQDRRKVDEYLDSVRSVERRIAAAESHSASARREPPRLALPEGVPANYEEHIRIMSDLLVLALQNDLTRVVTFMYMNESSDHTFPHLGVRENHHALSHYNPNTEEGQARFEQLKIVDRFYIEQLRYLLMKLKGIGEGQGTLLDNCMVVYCSGLSYANRHSRLDIPVILCGRGAGTLDPGRHVRYPAGTPFSNLLLSLLDRLDVRVERLSDSTGRLPQLRT